jgi:hypothetical protein
VRDLLDLGAEYEAGESVTERELDTPRMPSTNQLHIQLLLRIFAALNFPRLTPRLTEPSTSMLTINGQAMHHTLRDFNRAAVGCPSMTGSWSRPVALNQRHYETELDR